ncbi:GSCOCG00000460001-RA-CDS [Cotesia congregata]|nr:GSCOCG00000460001-RA-CDS [Cotesia congregata]
MRTNHSMTRSRRYSAAGKLSDCSGATRRTSIPSMLRSSIVNPGLALKYSNRIRFKRIPIIIPYSRFISRQQTRVTDSGSISISKNKVYLQRTRKI